MTFLTTTTDPKPTVADAITQLEVFIGGAVRGAGSGKRLLAVDHHVTAVEHQRAKKDGLLGGPKVETATGYVASAVLIFGESDG